MKMRTRRCREVQQLARSRAARKVAGSELERRVLIGPRTDASVPQLHQTRTSARRFREQPREMYVS